MKIKGIHIEFFFLLIVISGFFTIHGTIVNNSFIKINQNVFSLNVFKISFIETIFKGEQAY